MRELIAKRLAETQASLNLWHAQVAALGAQIEAARAEVHAHTGRIRAYEELLSELDKRVAMEPTNDNTLFDQPG